VNRSMWNVLKCLATSRKVWVAVIGAATAIYLYIKGMITAERLAQSLVALATAVIVSIAAEDSAEKIGGGFNPPTEREIIDTSPRCVECGKKATHVAEGPTWYCAEHRPWDAISVTVEEL